MRRIYRYVGAKHIADRAPPVPAGILVEAPEDILGWIRETHQELDATGNVIATFIVDESGGLRIADRRSEHVVCAGGRPVRSAGEMTFTISRNIVRVTWITNQSTGYCPEPESWPAVRDSLEHARIPSLDGFSQAFHFRRCPTCGFINIIKNELFECGVCSAPLAGNWNFDAEDVRGQKAS
jgi:hypothetical protein